MGTAHQAGHRKRMRDKFIRLGAEAFETYELLEMLLYYSVPVKDTKAQAKNLLHTFATVDKMLSATEEELTRVEGIGKKSAELISLCGRLVEHCIGLGCSKASTKEEKYQQLGALFVECFRGAADYGVFMVSLDNGMNLLGVDKIYDLDYSSGAVKARGFLDAAVARRASLVAIAYNHPRGVLFPTPSEYQTNIMVRSALDDVGIGVFETYLVCMDEFLGIISHFPRKKDLYSKFTSAALDTSDASESDTHNLLSRLLSFALPTAEVTRATDALISGFAAPVYMFEVEFSEICEMLGGIEKAALLIKLCAAFAARRRTDGVVRGRKCSEDDMRCLVVGLLFGHGSERVYVIAVDEEGRFLGSRMVLEGTVNYSILLTRVAVDFAKSLKASSVIVAHNHPRGVPVPSSQDVDMTQKLKSVLRNAGITLLEHYVCSGGQLSRIMPRLEEA